MPALAIHADNTGLVAYAGASGYAAGPTGSSVITPACFYAAASSTPFRTDIILPPTNENAKLRRMGYVSSVQKT